MTWCNRIHYSYTIKSHT